jgi:hypothetical protein
MQQDSRAALALAAGSVAVLVTMGLHPTGGEVLQRAASGGTNALVRSVHGLAILAVPFLGCGMGWVSWRLRERPMLSSLGAASYVLALLAVVIAAVASGFIAPGIAEWSVGADADEQAMRLLFFRYTGRVNQAFALVYVLMSAVAMACWSAAMMRSAYFPRGLAWLGVAIAITLASGIVTGRLSLGVHGFGGVVLAQTVWVGWTALSLHRSAGRSA